MNWLSRMWVLVRRGEIESLRTERDRMRQRSENRLRACAAAEVRESELIRQLDRQNEFIQEIYAAANPHLNIPSPMDCLLAINALLDSQSRPAAASTVGPSLSDALSRQTELLLELIASVAEMRAEPCENPCRISIDPEMADEPALVRADPSAASLPKSWWPTPMPSALPAGLIGTEPNHQVDQHHSTLSGMVCSHVTPYSTPVTPPVIH